MTDILDRLEDDETPMNDSLAVQAANEIRRLRAEASSITCSFCRWTAPRSNDACRQMADHVTECDKHPLRLAVQDVQRLELLLIRKNEALAIVASPSMWERRWTDDIRLGQFFFWNGTAEFADPMAWARRESEATDANS